MGINSFTEPTEIQPLYCRLKFHFTISGFTTWGSVSIKYCKSEKKIQVMKEDLHFMSRKERGFCLKKILDSPQENYNISQVLVTSLQQYNFVVT